MPDTFAWYLDQFRDGKLPAMIDRAGYPTIAAAVDQDLIAYKLPEIESTAKAMIVAAPNRRRRPQLGCSRSFRRAKVSLDLRWPTRTGSTAFARPEPKAGMPRRTLSLRPL